VIASARSTRARPALASGWRPQLEEGRAEAGDAGALGVFEAQCQSAYDEVEVATAMENALLRQTSGVYRPFGDSLRSTPTPSTRCRSSRSPPRRSARTSPSIMSMDETCTLTGRSLMAAPVDIGDAGGARDGSRLGIAPHPQPPISLLDLFRSAPFDGLRKSYMQRTSGVTDAGIQVEGQVKQGEPGAVQRATRRGGGLRRRPESCRPRCSAR
jgi:hypothetical protein